MSVSVGKKSNKWIAFSSPLDDPPARLICFPYGGGGASAYRRWQAVLDDDIEVCPVQLPGREGRFGEKAYTKIDELIDVMLESLIELFDRPVFFFGYSLGAAIAYKVAAHCAERRIKIDLKGLICCARKAPTREPSQDALDYMTDDEFLDHIVSLGGVTESGFRNEELKGIATRLLRSDFQLSASILEPRDKMIDAPLTVIGGASDQTVFVNELNEWQRVTSGLYRCLVLPGGHFFMHENTDRFMATLKDVLGL